MPDPFENAGTSLDSPASRAEAISPHDTNPLGTPTRAIYVGGTGDVVLRAIGSAADVTFKAVPAGSVLPVRASHVRSTSTTATHLVALI